MGHLFKVLRAIPTCRHLPDFRPKGADMIHDSARQALEPLTHDSLSSYPHGFLPAWWGFYGIYESLNTGRGSDDAAAAIAENRRRVCVFERVLVTPHQARAKAVYIKDAEDDTPAVADALVTDRRALAWAFWLPIARPYCWSTCKPGFLPFMPDGAGRSTISSSLASMP